VDAMAIADAARGWCDLLWLVDGRNQSVVAAAAAGALRSGDRHARGDAGGDGGRAGATSARRLITFFDTGMEELAVVAERLGLAFHSPEVARRLQDKLFQRDALRAAGLPTPQVVDLPVAPTARPSSARLSPRLSRGAEAAPRVGELADLPGGRPIGAWRVVGGAGDRQARASRARGVPLGRSPHAGGLRGRLRLGRDGRRRWRSDAPGADRALPARATFSRDRLLHPATLNSELQAEVVALAAQALAALGFEHGCAHTEVKLTAEGPRVIEVNGRIGGGVPDMLRLASGVDMMTLAMKAAIGVEPALTGLPTTTAVGYRFFFQPPCRRGERSPSTGSTG